MFPKTKTDCVLCGHFKTQHYTLLAEDDSIAGKQGCMDTDCECVGYSNANCINAAVTSPLHNIIRRSPDPKKATWTIFICLNCNMQVSVSPGPNLLMLRTWEA